MADRRVAGRRFDVIQGQRSIAVTLDEGIPGPRRGPGVIPRGDEGAGGTHRRVALMHMPHPGVVEIVMRVAAPALPVPIHPQRQIVTHAQQTPGHIPFPGNDGRHEHMPEQPYLPSFGQGHPASPAGTAAEAIAGGQTIVVGQQADGVTTEGVPDPVQWQVFLAEHVHRGGQILLRPVQIAHLEALQLPRAGFTGTTEVDGHDVETATGSMFGETSIEALGYPGTAGHQEIGPGPAHRLETIGTQPITVTGNDSDLLGANVDGGGCCGHDELRTAVSCWNQGSGMTADKARARCAFSNGRLTKYLMGVRRSIATASARHWR